MLDPTVLAAAQYVLETVNPSDIVERAPDDLIQEAFIAGARWQGSCARGRMACDSQIEELEAKCEKFRLGAIADSRWREEIIQDVNRKQARIDRLKDALEGLTNAALAGLRPLPSQVDAGFEALKAQT